MAFRGNKRPVSPSHSASAGMTGSPMTGSKAFLARANTMSLTTADDVSPASVCASSSDAAVSSFAVSTSPGDDLMRSRSHTFSGRSEEAAPMASAATATPTYDEAFNMDWSQTAVDGKHMWGERDNARENCYVCGDGRARGTFLKCYACKVIVHVMCTKDLVASGLTCRPTFREYTMSTSPDDFIHRHHWVNQRRPTGKCAGCNKTFNPKFAFSGTSSRDFPGVGCSWCKLQYHNNCFRFQLIDEPCSLGEFSSMILPPACVVRLPKFDEAASRRRRSIKRRSRRSKEQRYFTIQPQKAAQRRPLLVFINPKSGGNQGAKLLAKFVWLLNPRQVFNLLDGGPSFGLRLFARVQRARILVCGGDGTIGWILSVIDQLKIRPCPPIAVLPIGTGNDLARTLNWGGGYQDEPLTRILHQVDDAAIIHLDRWDLQLTPIPVDLSQEDEVPAAGAPAVSDTLPLTVMNNYFSMGADALVVLDFHESREAKPERFNSRWYNKIYYAQAGGKELFERKLRDLFKHVEVTADGVDLTPRIREQRVAALACINITRYSAGTQPWGIPAADCEFGPTQLDDGKFEIIGFTTPMLATLQMGSHGIRLAQCSQAVISTKRVIPAQVDGEPCRLAPSTIVISMRNRACMLQRVKRKDRLVTSMTSYPANLVENRFQQTDEALLEGEFEVINPTSITSQHGTGGSPASPQSSAKPSAQVTHSAISPLGSPLAVASMNHRSLSAMSPGKSRSANSSPLHSPGVTRTRLKRLSLSNQSLPDQTGDLLNGAVQCFNVTPPPGVVKTKGAPTVVMATDSAPAGITHRHPVSILVRNGLENPSSGHPIRRRSPCSSIADSVDDIVEESYGMPGSSSSCSSSKHSVSSVSDPPHSQMQSSSSTTSCTSRNDILITTTASGHDPGEVQRALFNACRQGNQPGVGQALSLGASLTLADGDGLTPLHLAARHNRKHIVSHLLSLLPRAAIDQVDSSNGRTALHKATWHGYPEVCQLLVDAGASLTIADGNAQTPYMLSQQVGNLELQKFMFACEQRQRIKEDQSETAV
ncbi:diacylglycerol kinase zeta-like [Sycon ciliatum]|uniref:diacylglycerol kinase zeta-like n=1 Tax=Sycon ciliatum TaxID=27933 RepID=UPI0031F63DEE